MLLLVSGATKTVQRFKHSPHLGHLLTPANGNSVASILATGLPWAVDNGAFSDFDRAAYIRLLRAVAGQAGLLWVVAPDVVGDAAATDVRFRLWLPTLRYFGVPVAYVAQNGCSVKSVPWLELDCLFIGGGPLYPGGPEWKESATARALVIAAKERGLWAHVGRVNSRRRMLLCASWGVDSIDGGQFSMYPDTHMPPALRALAHTQLGLWEAA